MRNFAVSFLRTADRLDLLIGQLAITIEHASVRPAMPRSVSCIFFSGPPSQIIQPVIQWITIQMAAFHAFWSRAVKRFEHEQMDEFGIPWPDVYPCITIRLDRDAQHPTFELALRAVRMFRARRIDDDSIQRAHAPLIADLIRAFVSSYRTPRFAHEREISASVHGSQPLKAPLYEPQAFRCLPSRPDLPEIQRAGHERWARSNAVAARG